LPIPLTWSNPNVVFYWGERLKTAWLIKSC